MLIYERRYNYHSRIEIPAVPAMSPGDWGVTDRGWTRPKAGIIPLRGKGVKELLVCQLSEMPDNAEREINTWLQSNGLSEFIGESCKEITVRALAERLELSGIYAREILHCFDLEPFVFKEQKIAHLVQERVVSFGDDDTHERRLNLSRHRNCLELTQELIDLSEGADDRRAYVFVSENEPTAWNRLALLMKELYAQKRLHSGRVCIVDPCTQMLPINEFYKLYTAQEGGVVLIDMRGLREDRSVVMLNWMRIGVAANRHRHVLTVFLADQSYSKLLDFAEKGMRDMSLRYIRSDTHPEEKQPCAQKVVTKTRELHQPLKAEGSSAMSELENLIGLTEVKQVIRQAADYGRAQKIYESRGFRPQKLGMHMAFTGSPGTAKTTVARLTAQIFKEQGVLSKGHLIEVGRADLVGKYVGWSAQQVKEKIEAAKGGVLFIDEAYALVDENRGSFGDEAINTLVQELENHRHDLVVILAGYKDPIEELLSRNPGLRSRITFHVDFPDYTEDELFAIFRKQLQENERMILPEDEPQVRRILRDGMRDPEFGNGRFVRNLVEKALLAQASRLMRLEHPERVTDEEIRRLTIDDLMCCGAVRKQTQIAKRVIGFVG